MNNIIERVWNRNSMVTIEDLRGMTFQAEEAGHTFRIRGVDGAGNAVLLSGTPAGVMLRPDNTDVALDCSVADGCVEATLPAECYDVAGRFGITVYLTSDSQKTAIYAAVGSVSRTSSGNESPGTTASVVDLVNAIEAAIEQIPATDTALKAAMAPTYSTSGLYAVGSYAWYNGTLYRCTTAITSGETWTSGHWTAAAIGSDVCDLKSALEGMNPGAEKGYSSGGYINCAQSTIDRTVIVPSANYKYLVDSCLPGDMYLINASGAASAKPWTFIDSTGKRLTYYTSSGDWACNMQIVQAPANSAYLISNYLIADTPYPLAYKFSNSVFGKAKALDYTKAVSIPSGSDLNNCQTPGNYYVENATTAEQIDHIPEEISGRLTV